MALPRLAAALILAGLLVVPGGRSAHADMQPQLIPFPTAVRPNDVFYLAGGHFPARQDLDVYMFCTDPWHSSFGHWKWTLPGARVGNGNFTAWKLHSPTPFLGQKTDCTITARDGYNPYGVVTQITILPVDSAPRKIRIPLAISVRHSPRGSQMQKIRITSVPGARVSTVVTSPSDRTPHRFVTNIPWTGDTMVRWKIPAQARHGDAVSLTVNARLGTYPMAVKTTRFLLTR